jgi:hypothetical protein
MFMARHHDRLHDEIKVAESVASSFETRRAAPPSG